MGWAVDPRRDMGGIEELIEAVARGDVERARALIAAEPSLVAQAGAHGKTALHWAAERDQAEIAALLLEAGADLEARTDWGASPFDWAAAMGSAVVAALLLERGASGLTLITGAALGMEELVRSVVGSGEDLRGHRRRDAPGAPDEHWPVDSAHIQGDVLSDALYAAARNGHTGVVSYLKEHGASVDAKGFFGASAVHWAALNGHRRTVELLVASGADVSRRDPRFDATPEGWAAEGGHVELARILRNARTGTA